MSVADEIGTVPRASVWGRRQVHLVGFMGSGKSTVGQLLARRLVWNFLDLDALVARHAGRPIAEIFASEGESGFREIERHALRQAVQKPRTVVALGGGAFASSENRALSAAAAVAVWLRCEMETLRRRIGESGASRPLWRPGPELDALLERRSAHYALADLIVDAEEGPQEVADEIERRLSEDREASLDDPGSEAQ